ncbi:MULTISPECIES: DUF4192 family protein [unclassified Knoellia]|uniref:DUF4192 family protein n=1 Tax=Knoellia altitudinis TaxID=3404795 RepID=UPI0036240821
MTSVKISTTDELLAVLPHQLGYRLEDCVAILMVTDKIVGPVARTDLPSERDVEGVAAGVLDSLLRVGPELAMLVGYESVPGQSRSLMRALHHGLLDAGVQLIDHVVVRGGRWWGWCCRPRGSLDAVRREHLDGHAMADEASVPAVAEFIARGSAPLSGREAMGDLVAEDPSACSGVGDALEEPWEDIVSQIDPEGVLEIDPDDVDTPGLADELAEARARAADWIGDVDRVPHLWARVLAPEGERGDTFEVSDADVALMTRSLVNKPWRDALIAWMSPVMFPLDQVDDASRGLLVEHVEGGPATTSERSQTVLRRLLRLGTRVPDDWSHEAAAICTVSACVAWGIGNGSTAGDAVARALRVEPGYTLARYLGRMVDFQMRPRHAWTDLAA